MTPRLIVEPERLRSYWVWDLSEWCKKLPKWWLEACGCRQECELNRIGEVLWDMHTWYAKMLMRDGFVVVDGWGLRRYGDKVRIYPWPRRMYRTLDNWTRK